MMSTPHSQWGKLLRDDGQEMWTGQTVAATAPLATAKVGVPCANRRKLTIRSFNTAGVGQFDVEVFLQYAVDEPWILRIASATITGNGFATIEATGAIRCFPRVFNFAGGASATVRVSGGD